MFRALAAATAAGVFVLIMNSSACTTAYCPTVSAFISFTFIMLVKCFFPLKNDTFNLNICYSCHSDCTMKYDEHYDHSLCAYTITEIHNLMSYSKV